VHEFAVWAPDASRVMVHLPGLDRREPMRRQDDGWWSAAVAEAGHGTDYGFTLDGGPLRPDPRSPWQPAGVHGASRTFDASAHPWQDAAWIGRPARGALFYELHIGTFTPEGTLDAAIARLDHVRELGVDMVELLPVAAFPGAHGWGYDGVGLYAVHDAYGGPAALQRFVDACHRLGMGVCLDVVYNHLGPDGNYLRDFGPYFTGTHHTPWGEAVNLDAPGSDEVRRFIVENALRWFRDFHLDCLRLDAVHALVDTSKPHLLAELSAQVGELSSALGRPLGLVAESDLNDPGMIDPVSTGGLGMDAQWDDDVHHALHTWLTGERQGYYGDFGSTAVLARVLTEAFRHAGDYSSFREQVWGVPIDPERHRGHQFVAALQNHDQIGNRATGDRLTASLSPGRLAAGAAILLTSPFTPLLFMGEEWGARTPWQFFTSHESPELAEAVRQGRRSEFAAHGWDAQQVPDPQDPATRDRSVLDWSEPARTDADGLDHAALLTWYRQLIELRKTWPDLGVADDLRQVQVEFGDAWIVIRRGSFATAVNLGPQADMLPVPEGYVAQLAWGRFGESQQHPLTASADGLLVGPDEVAVLQAESETECEQPHQRVTVCRSPASLRSAPRASHPGQPAGGSAR
jgi:maltooligosyltrehalose trehalohydrolase